ncbi:SETMAR [Cordylochernes scorpioides]|uniref:SETMAR n=1 Tax=Cordylochernes scorpioides TaxID=51811 RepID=A0ABY6K5W6_9ARAC|nr:SETMAR [Cordylochernes scorpioides]
MWKYSLTVIWPLDRVLKLADDSIVPIANPNPTTTYCREDVKKEEWHSLHYRNDWVYNAFKSGETRNSNSAATLRKQLEISSACGARMPFQNIIRAGGSKNLQRRYVDHSTCLRRYFCETRMILFSAVFLTCVEIWILYDNRRRSAQWLERDAAPKHFPN